MSSYLPRFGSAVRLTLMVLMTLVLAVAQSDRGTITGTVTDPTSAVIPGAAIHARNTAMGSEYDTVSTATGNYTLPSLIAGSYDLTVSAAGFSKYIQHGITVQVVQTLRVDVVLAVGATSESVTVTADAPLLRTENAERSYNLSTERVNALPNNNPDLRSPFGFASIMPGVTGDTTGGGGSMNIKVNGSPDTSFKVLLDGQDITATYSDASHSASQQPAVEALQEFTLQASNFAAEFGQITGGLYNFTTKSGTNGLHGSAFIFVKNEDLGAGKPYTNSGNGHLVRPSVRGNDWGGSIGGPVVIPHLYNGRNKTFFFANLERYKHVTSTDTFYTMPTTQMRNGDFSQVLTGRTLGTNPAGGSIMENMIFDPLTNQTVNGQVTRTAFPGNVIPASRFDPVALKIQAWFPAPTRSGIVNNWEQQYVSPDLRYIPSIKMDQNIGNKSKLSFYAAGYMDASRGRKDALPTPITGEQIRKHYAKTFTLHYDYTASPTLLFHAGFGFIYTIGDTTFLPGDMTFNPATELGLIGNPTVLGMPQLSGLGNTTQGGLSVQYNLGVASPGTNYEIKPTTILNASYVRGNHTYKIGAQWNKDPWINDAPFSVAQFAFSGNQTALPYLQTTSIGGANIGLPYASFLMGLVNSATVPAMSSPYYTKNSWGLYVQDTWKITRKLTLDYGLRWDYQGAPEERHYRSAMFGPTISNPTAGGLPGGTVYEGYGPGRCNCRFTDTYPYAVGPRLGIAYQFAPKMVLRAGWGISYGNTVQTGQNAAPGVGWNPLSFSSTSFGNPAATLRTGLQYNPADLFTVTLDPGIRPSPGQINSPSYYLDRSGGRPPRYNQWNIGVQREITKDIVVEAAYVGNRGVWQLSSSFWDLNVLTPQRIAAAGLNINNAADRTLLNSAINSSTAASRGFGKLPYAGFPATLTVAQSLRPYPQFGSILDQWAPLGKTWYDGLQATATKRTSHGLDATAAFTWSKTLDSGAESFNGGGVVNDQFNRQNQKALSSAYQPFVFVVSFNYRVPKLGPNRWVRAVTGNWTLSGVGSYASGNLIPVPTAQNNLSSLLFRGTLSNRVPGQPLYLTDMNGPIDPNKVFALNPKAWSDPAAGQWGFSAPYYNDYRYRRRPSESAGIGRIFPIWEKMRLEIRGEFFNVFNRLQVPNPSAGNALATQVYNAQGVPSSGFGYMNGTSGSGQRSGQIMARFQF